MSVCCLFFFFSLICPSFDHSPGGVVSDARELANFVQERLATAEQKRARERRDLDLRVLRKQQAQLLAAAVADETKRDPAAAAPLWAPELLAHAAALHTSTADTERPALWKPKDREVRSVVTTPCPLIILALNLIIFILFY